MSDTLITIFTAPKPFTDPHINLIQRNAIRSWVNLGGSVEVLLISDEEGVADVAQEMDVRHLPQVECNRMGTPLISSIFKLARMESESPFLAIVNTDILLFPNLISATQKVAEELGEFVIVGQRWDMDVREPLNYPQNFFKELEELVRIRGSLHSQMGSDYFIFPRDCFMNIPEFAIGRAGWDNWMIFKARREGWKVVDATQDILIAHQNHDYSHLAGGQPHYRQSETKENVHLAGGEHTIFTLFDAQIRLVDGTLVKSGFSWKKFWREVEIFPLVKLKLKYFGIGFYYLFHPLRAYQDFRKVLRDRNVFK
ncbi:MAG TPA: hypothetical protein G4N92_02590 [Anaerolineae bacterium]|nr:hypothetical protein [Anaerolineae bacterium]